MNLKYSFFLFALLITVTSCGEKKEAEKTKPKTEITEDQRDEEQPNVILFFGNSLTAGLGLDPEDSFPAVIQAKIDSLGLNYRVVNAGLSGETTASGKNRLEWVMNQEVDIFVLELGANDGLRGIPVSETEENLQDIIDTVKKMNPETKIILAGMQIPPNLGQEYTANFKAIFPTLAKRNDVQLIPFLLEDVAGNPELNQSDGIHPTAEGQEIVAENVWKVVGPMIADKDE